MEKIKRLRRRRPRDGAFCCKFARRQGVCCDCTVLCDKLEKGFHLCRKNDRMCMNSSLSCGRVLYCFCSRRAAVYTLDAALASAYKYRNTQGCSRRCPLPPHRIPRTPCACPDQTLHAHWIGRVRNPLRMAAMRSAPPSRPGRIFYMNAKNVDKKKERKMTLEQKAVF